MDVMAIWRASVNPTGTRTTPRRALHALPSAPGVERLEGRVLLSAVIHEFPITSDAEFDLIELANGPDGSIRFSLQFSNEIGRFDPATGSFSVLPALDPRKLITGPDGNLWFAGFISDRIYRMTTDGSVSAFAFPGNHVGVSSFVSGPDENIWFASSSLGIGRLTTNGEMTMFAVKQMGDPITLGPDASIWFATDNSIGRLTTSGQITEFPLLPGGSPPLGIVTGPDGNLWFTESAANKIGRISPAGTISEFDVPTPKAYPYSITVGPDGNVWFTEATSGRIGRITPDGAITEFSTPSAAFQLQSLVAGSDGNLWFVEPDKGQLGEVLIDHSIVASTLDVQGVQGQAWSGVVADFTSSEPGSAAGDFTASIHWSDGTRSVGSIAPDGHGGFQVTASHTSAAAGAGNFTVEIIANHGTASAFALGNEMFVDNSGMRIVTAEVPPLGGSAGTSVAPVVTVANGSAGSPIAAPATRPLQLSRSALLHSLLESAERRHPRGPLSLPRAFHGTTQPALRLAAQTRAISQSMGRTHRLSTHASALVASRVSSTLSHYR